MVERKKYERPVLEVYGDIKLITAGRKEFGFADGMLLKLNVPANPPAGQNYSYS